MGFLQIDPQDTVAFAEVTVSAALVQGYNITLSADAKALGQTGGHLTYHIPGDNSPYSVSFPAGSSARDIALTLHSANPGHFDLGDAFESGVLIGDFANMVFDAVGQKRAQAASVPGTAALVQGYNITLSSEAIALGQTGGHLTYHIPGGQLALQRKFSCGFKRKRHCVNAA